MLGTLSAFGAAASQNLPGIKQRKKEEQRRQVSNQERQLNKTFGFELFKSTSPDQVDALLSDEQFTNVAPEIRERAVLFKDKLASAQPEGPAQPVAPVRTNTEASIIPTRRGFLGRLQSGEDLDLEDLMGANEEIQTRDEDLVLKQRKLQEKQLDQALDPKPNSSGNTRFMNVGGGSVFDVDNERFIDASDGSAGGNNSGGRENDIPASARNKIADLKTMNEIEQSISAMLDDPAISAELGPVMGRVNAARNYMFGGSGISPKMTAFRSKLFNMVDLWLRERSGAAVPPEEVRNAMNEIVGGPSSTPETIRARLTAFTDVNKSRIRNMGGTVDDSSGLEEEAKSRGFVQNASGKWVKANGL